MKLFYDRAPLMNSAARITPEGYLVADAYVARANNVQEYTAGELGLTDRASHETVRVFRPEDEVFATDSLRSASRLPITLDHPRGMVDAKNFVEYARGETGEQVMRDGEFLRVPIRVTDASAVSSVQTDRHEFSMGYTGEIKMQDGTAPDGTKYDAVLTNIRYNHLAACRAARGGPELRITDERPAPVQSGAKPMKTILIDGLPVDVSNPDTAETVMRNLITARDQANEALEAATKTVEARDAKIAERDAEIAKLKDAAKPPSPAEIRAAGAAYARDCKIADAFGVKVTDDMGSGEIRKAVVVAKIGDASKEYTDAQFTAAFDTLALNVEDSAKTPDPLRQAIGDSVTKTPVADATKAFADARAKRLERYETAHRQPASTQ